jgi:hypothetical protein
VAGIELWLEYASTYSWLRGARPRLPDGLTGSSFRSVSVQRVPRTIRSIINQGAHMNRLFSAKPLLAAAVALGAIGAASAAHARTDVVFSVGIPAYVEPAPVYVQPRPVYVQPQTVYYGHRYVERQGAWGDRDRDGVPNIYDRDSRYYNPRVAYEHRQHGWRDSDRDGVPDRFDARPHNPYRR